MKYPINKVVFIHKNKVGASIVIDRYLKHLDINKRVFLMGILESDPLFKKDFGERLMEFDGMFRLLISENKHDQVKALEVSVDFTDRPYPDNIYTLEMYKNLLSGFLEYFKQKINTNGTPKDMAALILNLRVIFRYSAINDEAEEIFTLYE